MVDSAELSLPGVTSSVPAARRFVRETLSAWGLDDLVDAAALVVSELTTNAVLHARTALVIGLSTDDGGGLRVEVVDTSAVIPRARSSAQSATTGRGLAIVGELARDWGVDSSTGRGKVVWAELLPDTDAGRRPASERGALDPASGSTRSGRPTADPVALGMRRMLDPAA